MPILNYDIIEKMRKKPPCTGHVNKMSRVSSKVVKFAKYMLVCDDHETVNIHDFAKRMGLAHITVRKHMNIMRDLGLFNEVKKANGTLKGFVKSKSLINGTNGRQDVFEKLVSALGSKDIHLTRKYTAEFLNCS